MNPGLRSALAILLSAVATGAEAGCGGGSDGASRSEPTGQGARDQAIAARLTAYIDRNNPNGQRPLPPPEGLPPRERRAFAELADNIAELKQSIERISVRETVITVYTNLAADKEGLQTARLICTEIYGADVADFTKGHEVRDLNGRALVKCLPGTNPLK